MAELTPPQSIPVICDRCRAQGMAGDEAFAGIPDLLDFEPVPRRARADGWKPEHQRAFIAALAVTGSPRRAARAIGKHAFGAEQLRKARGARSFAAAWDAALDLYREREMARLKDNLADLAKEEEQRSGSPFGLIEGEGDFDDDREHSEYLGTKARIRDRLLRARRIMLRAICDDPAKRAAWEVLSGPVDWAKAERLEPQDNEPFPSPDGMTDGMPSMLKPDMLLATEHGLLPDVVGGYDALAEIRQAVEEIRQAAAEGGGSAEPRE